MMKDINGAELKAGDSVVMGINQYDSGRLVKGTVEKIAPRKQRRRDAKPCVYVRQEGGYLNYTWSPELQILKV